MPDKQDKMASSNFLPSSAINKFIALRSLAKPLPPTAPSPVPTSSSNPSKKPRTYSVSPVTPTSLIPQQYSRHSVSRSGSHAGSTLCASNNNSVRSYSSTASSPALLNRSLIVPKRPPSLPSPPLLSLVVKEEPLEKHIDLPTPVPREYDPLPAPESQETHKYIASSRLIQKNALVRAIVDPDCGCASLVERDFEYLRDVTPDTMQGWDTTSPVEADLILDEHTAIIFQPLGDLGQAAGLDVEGGLKALVATLARIGPRYKNLWLIFEEYYSPAHLVTAGNIRATGMQRAPSAPPLSILARPNPYTGPTMKNLSQFMAWVPFTQTRTCWLSRIHHSLLGHPSHQTKVGNARQQGPFGLQDPGQAMDEIPFETQVLFASDERSAARMVRAIGEGIVRRIDRAAKAGIRRDEDGWQDAAEWLWRDWLSDQDSTHERFLGAFRIFNPFSIQLILSLCSLKEFFAMDHQQRCKTVGRFVDASVLAIFDKVVATPMS
ncbi:hypothetical protein BG015_005121 [Linnemannia schmuckeri]|uniref:Uncharacterized protein n=1 Tax=Linnemannia schmuckeri TaxID=64567 RepID=A0A9P5S4Q1_9FUNG|nr:hypothetical protein BG015_005121 [Linnemannia schmuckeri]